jgi:cytochrome c556
MVVLPAAGGTEISFRRPLVVKRPRKDGFLQDRRASRCCYTRAGPNRRTPPMRKTAPLLALAAVLATAAATAAVKPDTAIHYRQSVYTMIGWNFMPLVAMIKNKTPWDSAEFAKHADRIAQLTPQLLEGFPQGSDTGARTEAKPEIWKNMSDFESKMDTLVRESKALADVAKTGDEAKMREQFDKTAGACKSCHDKYRNKE